MFEAPCSSLAASCLCGTLGYWEDTVDTLIITGVSVAVCILIGIPLGIWMSRSKAVTAALTPVLDVMQTMPSFAYLAPLALFFGIGPAAAVVTTLIYALPPLVRISAHGLRSVSPTTMEATEVARVDPEPAAHQGAVADGSSHDPCRAQPDHHGGPVDGGHRRAHRWSGPWCPHCSSPADA